MPTSATTTPPVSRIDIRHRTPAVQHSIRRALLLPARSTETEFSTTALASITTMEIGPGINTPLQAGDFADLPALEQLSFSGSSRAHNNLHALPDRLFNGLSNLKRLSFSYTRFTGIPTDIFVGLVNLERVDINPQYFYRKPDKFNLPFTITWEDASRRVYVVLKHGAPFPMTITLTLTNATFSDGGSTAEVTIATGATESIRTTITAARPRAGAVTIDLTPPTLPQHHEGYEFTTPDSPYTLLPAPTLAFVSEAEDRSTLQNIEITAFTLPAATAGNPPYRYTLSPALPTGLAFNANTRIVSGTPRLDGTTLYTYRAEDDEAFSTQQFVLTVITDLQPDFDETIPSQIYIAGVPPDALNLTTLPEATSGDAPLSYSLSPALPPSLNFNPQNRELSGTPDAVADEATYTYSVKDIDGDTTTLEFTVLIEPDVMPEFARNENIPAPTWIQGDRIDPWTLPPATGGNAPLTYHVTPLAPGLTFTSATRTISGTPTETGHALSQQYYVTDRNGDSDFLNFALSVIANPKPNFGTATIDPQTYIAGPDANFVLQLPPASIISGAVRYTLAPADGGELPGWLFFVPETQILTARPVTASATTTYRYTASDTDPEPDTATLEFTITVATDTRPKFAPDAILPLAAQHRVVGEVLDLTLPAATGGNGVLVYQLEPALPPNLVFNVTTDARTISGELTQTMPNTRYTYTVTDENKDTIALEFDFSVINNLVPFFAEDDSIAEQIYSTGRPIRLIALPQAIGGNGALKYRIDNLPSGLELDPVTRELSGIPESAHPQQQHQYIVEDRDGSTASLTFSLFIQENSAPVLPPIRVSSETGRVTFFTGIEVEQTIATHKDSLFQDFNPMPEPNADTGNPPFRYSITPALPRGLVFNEQMRYIVGTPIERMAAKTFTYTVTDVDGQSDSQTFSLLVDAGGAFSQPVFPDTPEIAEQTYRWYRGESYEIPLPLITNLNALIRDADDTFPIYYELAGGELPQGLAIYDGDAALPDPIRLRLVGQNVAPTIATPVIRGRISHNATVGMRDYIWRVRSTYAERTNNTHGGSDAIPFAIEIRHTRLGRGLEFDTTIAAQAYFQNKEIAPIILPMASGGVGRLTYRVDDLPPGLSFTPATRILSGEPTTAVEPATEATYTVTDVNDVSLKLPFTIEVEADTEPNFAVQTVAPLSLVLDQPQAIPLTLPAATNGNRPLLYNIDRELPPGLSFQVTANMDDRDDLIRIAGTPTALQSATTYTYRVTDTDGDTAELTFTLAVVPLPLSMSVSTEWQGGMPEGGSNIETPYNLVADIASILATLTVSGGVPPYRISATGTIVSSEASLSEIPAITPQVTVLPPRGQGPFILRFANPSDLIPLAGDTIRLSVELLDADDARVGTDIHYQYQDGPLVPEQIVTVTSTASDRAGSEADPYLILPDTIELARLRVAPSGSPLRIGYEVTGDTEVLSFNEINGRITYNTDNPPPTNGDFNIVITLILQLRRHTTRRQSIMVYFRIDEFPDFGDQNIPPQHYRLAETVFYQPPVATGGNAPVSYSITPTLPTGLSFDSVRRLLTGTSEERRAAAAYTYIATDLHDNPARLTFTLSVGMTAEGVDPPEFPVAYITDKMYVTGKAVALTLPAATGVAPLRYSLTDVHLLATGLRFDATARTISGIPTDYHANRRYIYVVTDGNDNRAVLPFNLEVEEQSRPVFNDTIEAQNYISGEPHAAVDLPQASGGNVAFSYRLQPTLPPGLSFDADTRPPQITGMATGGTATGEYTYTVADIDGDTADLTFTLSVVRGTGRPYFDPAMPIDPFTFYAGFPLPPLTIFPAATGDGPMSYTISPTLPAGISFTATTRWLKGTPQALQPVTTYIYIATDADGDHRGLEFTIAIIEADLTAPKVSLAAPVSITEGDVLTITFNLDRATLQQLPIRYRITETGGFITPGDNTLPVSNASSRARLSIPIRRLAQITPNSSVTITLLTDTNTGYGYALGDPDTVTVAILDMSLSIEETIGHLQYRLGRYRNVVLPAAQGGRPYNRAGVSPYDYYVEPALPPGLSFIFADRALHGTPAELLQRAHPTDPLPQYTYIIIDADGLTVTQTFTLEVVPAGSGSQPYFTPEAAAYNDLTLARRRNIGLTLPAATGGDAPLSYTITPQLPHGLNFNSDTHVLSGYPERIHAATSYTYRVIDADGESAEFSFTIAVVTKIPPGFATIITDQRYIINRNIGRDNLNLTLPIATGGRLPMTYSLATDGPDNSLPQGLNFSPTTRQLSGTPTRFTEVRATYTATDYDRDTATITFMMTVGENLVPSLDHVHIPAQNYTYRYFINETLPEASGGDLPLSYSLRPASPATALPPGLGFNPTTRAINGIAAPLTEPAEFIYTATDRNGSTAEIRFMLAVRPDTTPNIATIAALDYRRGVTIEPLQLPVATGGNGTLVYSLLPAAPPGLTFDPQTRIISGTPLPPLASEQYTYRLVYQATDSDGDTGSTEIILTITNDSRPDFGNAIIENQRYIAGQEVRLSLPPAFGGNGKLTYRIVGLPAGGPEFNPDTRTISGHWGQSRDHEGNHLMTYSATDADGDSTDDIIAAKAASIIFNIYGVPDRRITFLYRMPHQSYIQNIDVTVTLPEARRSIEANPVISYALTPTLPAGLHFDPDRRLIQGNTSVSPRQGAYTYLAVDEYARTATLNFTITISENIPVSFNTDALEPLALAVDRPMRAHTLPTAIGNPPLTYAFSDLPPGLTFNADTRVLSGIPTTLNAATDYTYTAVDTNGDPAALPLGITIIANLTPQFAADASIAPVILQQYRPQLITLPTATGGNPPLTYRVEPWLPLLLQVIERDSEGVFLQGVPLASAETVTYTYIATDNDDDTAALTFTLGVTATEPVLSFDRAAIGDLLAIAGDSRELAFPALEGDQAATAVYDVIPQVPPGWTLTQPDANTDHPQLSATPTERQYRRSYFLTATVSTDSGNLSAVLPFSLAVLPEPFAQPLPDLWVMTGAEYTMQLPLAAGHRADFVYALEGVTDNDKILFASSGLNFTPIIRTLSGIGTTIAPVTLAYYYSVPQQFGGPLTSRRYNFQLTLTPSAPPTTPDLIPTFANTTIADFIYHQNGLIRTVTLPEASDGDQPLVYALSPNLPIGLQFDTDTRILAKDPAVDLVAQPRSRYTYIATDTDGDTATLTFHLTIFPAEQSMLRVDVTVSDDISGHGTPEQPYQLTLVDQLLATINGAGGNPPYTMQVQSSSHPAALWRTTTGAELRFTNPAGLPTANAAEYHITIAITDSVDRTTTRRLNYQFAGFIDQTNALRLPFISDYSFNFGDSLSKLDNLPAATGGMPPYTYHIALQNPADLPPDFGTLTTANLSTLIEQRASAARYNAPVTTSLRYRVTDKNAASVNQQFNVIVHRSVIKHFSGPFNASYAHNTHSSLTFRLEIDRDALPDNNYLILFHREGVGYHASGQGHFTVNRTSNEAGVLITRHTYFSTDPGRVVASMSIVTDDSDSITVARTEEVVFYFGALPTTPMPLGPTLDICSRTAEVRDYILLQLGYPGGSTGFCSAVPESMLAQFESLNLTSLEINRLQSDDFASLSQLHTIDLHRNHLTTLPTALFNRDLASTLNTINLNNNRLSALPATLFNGLSELAELHLANNELRNDTLPDGLFIGVNNLTTLDLSNNAEPLQLRVLLQQSAADKVQLRIPTAAPFAITVDFTIDNATLTSTTESPVTRITIPAGTDESELLTMTPQNSAQIASVEIKSLPQLPAGHSGYALTTVPGQQLAAITPRPRFNEVIENLVYSVNREIANATLPVATSELPLVYALSPDLPRGISFDSAVDKRILSGTPTILSPATEFTYTATNDIGISADLTFTIEIEADITPYFLDETIPNQYYSHLRYRPALGPTVLPAAIGNQPISYSINPLPPAGISFYADPTRRELRGRAVSIHHTESVHTYIATDRDGDTATITFAIRADRMVELISFASNGYFTVGVPVTHRLPAGVNGNPPLRYTLTPALPSGLSVVGTTIQGTPDTVTATTHYTWRVIDDNGDTRHRTFTLRVFPGALGFVEDFRDFYLFTEDTGAVFVLPPLTNAEGAITYELMDAPESQRPVVSSTPGTDNGYRTDFGFPSGIIFDPDIHTLHGTIPHGDLTIRGRGRERYFTHYLYRATDSATPPRTATRVITVYYEGAPYAREDIPLDFGDRFIDDLFFILGHPVDLQLPGAIAGDEPIKYSLSPALPAGLIFHPNSRRLLGTPVGSPMAAAKYTYVAEDNGITGLTYTQWHTMTFNITVSTNIPVSFGDQSIPDQLYRQYASVNLTMPPVVSGNAPIEYTLEPALPDPPIKLVEKADGRWVIEGVWRDVTWHNPQNFTWTATDVTGDARSLYFVIDAELTLSSAPVLDQIYRLGQTVDVQLPLALSGKPPIAYELTTPYQPLLPFDLRLNGTRIQGTASNLESLGIYQGSIPFYQGDMAYTWTVTDATGNSDSKSFNMYILPGGELYFIGDDFRPDYEISETIPFSYTFPAVGNAAGAVTYEIVQFDETNGPVHPDFRFDPNQRRLHGTISEEATYHGHGDLKDGDAFLTRFYYYRATDSANPPRSVQKKLTFSILPWERVSDRGDNRSLTFSEYTTIDDIVLKPGESVDVVFPTVGLFLDMGFGNPPVHYTINPTNLPRNLVYYPNARRLAGTIALDTHLNEINTYYYAYIATDTPNTFGGGRRYEADSDTVTFSITVDHPDPVNLIPQFTTDTIANPTFKRYGAVRFTLPEATGGDQSLTYALTGSLPSGVTRDGFIVSGNFEENRNTDTQYIWKVTDNNGDEVTLPFTVHWRYEDIYFSETDEQFFNTIHDMYQGEHNHLNIPVPVNVANDSRVSLSSNFNTVTGTTSGAHGLAPGLTLSYTGPSGRSQFHISGTFTLFLPVTVHGIFLVRYTVNTRDRIPFAPPRPNIVRELYIRYRSPRGTVPCALGIVTERDKNNFLNAANRNDITVIREYLARPCDIVNVVSPYNNTALINAANKGHLDIVNALLEQDGINLNAVNNDGNTALILATFEGHTNIVDVLIRKKSLDTNVVNNFGHTALRIAAVRGYSKIAAALMTTFTTDINRTYEEGNTALSLSLVKEHANTAWHIIFGSIIRKGFGGTGIDPNIANVYGATPLILAATKGYTAIVARLLKMDGINLNLADNSGYTALGRAAESGHTETVTELVGAGADLDTLLDSSLNTPLLRAIINNHTAAAIALIEGGADVNATNIGHHTALIWATVRDNHEVVQALIAIEGIDLDTPGSNGNTALHRAIMSNHIHIARDLMSAGADINVVNRHGDTPLILAAEKENSSIINGFISLTSQTVNVDAVNNRGISALTVAANRGLVSRARWLVESLNADTMGPIIKAVSDGHEQAVDTLIEIGADLDARGSRNRTPLILAAIGERLAITEKLIATGRVNLNLQDEFGDTALVAAIDNYHSGIALILIDAGANVNLANKYGSTALTLAAYFGLTNVVTALLATPGIAVNAIIGNGDTALHYATQFRATEIFTALINANGIDLNILNNDGNTPLHLAMRMNAPNYVLALINAGADVNITNSRYIPLIWTVNNTHIPILTAMLATTDIQINITDSDGDTALMHAIKINRSDIVMKLIMAGADVNLANTSGTTPLISAANYNLAPIATALLAVPGIIIDEVDNNGINALTTAAKFGYTETARILIAAGADEDGAILHAATTGHQTAITTLIAVDANINARDANLNTPLMLATTRGDTAADIVEALLTAGADKTATNANGQTALSIATTNNYPELIMLLSDS